MMPQTNYNYRRDDAADLRGRLETALRRADEAEAAQRAMRWEIARLEQAVDDLEEALLHALREKHAARAAAGGLNP